MLARIGRVFNLAINGLTSAVAYLAGGAILLMMAVICYEVAARYIFRAPTVWSLEIATYLLVLIAYFAASGGLRKGSHVSVDLVIMRFSERIRPRFITVATAFSVVFAIILGWQTWEYAFRAYHISEVAPTLMATPMFIPKLFVPIGCFIMALQGIAMVCSDIGFGRGKRAKRKAGEP